MFWEESWNFSANMDLIYHFPPLNIYIDRHVGYYSTLVFSVVNFVVVNMLFSTSH